MGMKLPLACYVLSAALVIAFIFKSIVDYSRYLDSYGSAPFHVNALYLVVPAIIVFVVGFIIKKRQR